MVKTNAAFYITVEQKKGFLRKGEEMGFFFVYKHFANQVNVEGVVKIGHLLIIYYKVLHIEVT